ncbi:hypothetical protein [Streptomyces sp. NPDC014006]
MSAISDKALFVRPDGHVAWAIDTEDGEGLPEALEHWLGAPTAAT